MHVNKVYILIREGRETKMKENMVVEIYIGLSGVKHNPITIKYNHRYTHRPYKLLIVNQKINHNLQ
jgi:hypothetical protein